ncbi:hypothetical protein PENTCL1PPCAC_21059, partial [Pristionchus entomophagus]
MTLERFVSIVYGTHVEAISLLRLRKLKFQSNVDRSFFLISFCIFLAQSFNIIVVLLFTYYLTLAFDNGKIIILNSIVVYTSDVFSLGPAMYRAIYTLIVPGPVRRKCFSLLSCTWCKHDSP